MKVETTGLQATVKFLMPLTIHETNVPHHCLVCAYQLDLIAQVSNENLCRLQLSNHKTLKKNVVMISQGH